MNGLFVLLTSVSFGKAVGISLSSFTTWRPSVVWYVGQIVFALRIQLTFLPNNKT